MSYVNSAILKIEKLFHVAHLMIQKIKEGDRIPATKLAKEISNEYNVDNFYPTLRFLLEDYPGIIITKGIHGGIQRISSTESTEHIDVALSKIEKIFVKAEEIIFSLKKDEKIAATTLAENLGNEFSVKDFYQTLRYYLNDNPNVIITKGRHGGITLK